MEGVSWKVFTDHKVKIKSSLSPFLKTDVLLGINSHKPKCSILVGDFKFKLDNKASQEIDTFKKT